MSQVDKSIIQDLLDKPFSTRSLAEKQRIISDGRPCPPLPNLHTVHRDHKRVYTRNFNMTQYELFPWLTGCKNLNKLYCWPCLLFSTRSGIWNSTGFDNLNTMNTSQKKHKTSVMHLQCTLDLINFGLQRIDKVLDNQLKFSNSEHNNKVRKNHEILKRLIDVTCLLLNQELPFRGHDESESSSNRGNYIEVLNVLKNYDSLLCVHLETDTVFKGTLSSIQNDLISAVHAVVLDEIAKQVDEAFHVAIMLDETSDTEMTSHLSTVLRYVYNGEVQERFIGFTEVSENRTSDGLLKHFQDTVSKFNLGHKLVAQTYDGASVSSEHLNDFQQKVLDSYPHVMYVHCYAHVLNVVLSQSLKDIIECNTFFSTLNGIATFGSHSTKRTYALKEYLKRKIPSLAATRWSFSSRLVNVVNEHRNMIVEYFRNIEGESWDFNDKIAAIGYSKFLNKFESVFLLEVFSTLFSHSDVLFNILQTKSLDVAYCNSKVQEFLNYLRSERESGFSYLWNKSNEELQCNENKKRRTSDGVDSVQERFRMLYYEIIDHLIVQMEVRFQNLNTFEFFALLDSDKFHIYNTKSTFPETLIQKLAENYKNKFDYPQLRNEFIAIYSYDDFKGLSVFDMIKWFRNNKIQSAFEESYKAIDLVATIPITTASFEQSLSTLKRIKTYLRSTQSQDRLNKLSLLTIEKALVCELKMKPNFYDIVIEKFTALDQRVEFQFK